MKAHLIRGAADQMIKAFWKGNKGHGPMPKERVNYISRIRELEGVLMEAEFRQEQTRILLHYTEPYLTKDNHLIMGIEAERIYICIDGC